MCVAGDDRELAAAVSGTGVPQPTQVRGNEHMEMLSLSLSLSLPHTHSGFCMVANSLLAYASVNHLHYHFIYTAHPLLPARTVVSIYHPSIPPPNGHTTQEWELMPQQQWPFNRNHNTMPIWGAEAVCVLTGS